MSNQPKKRGRPSKIEKDFFEKLEAVTKDEDDEKIDLPPVDHIEPKKVIPIPKVPGKTKIIEIMNKKDEHPSKISLILEF